MSASEADRKHLVPLLEFIDFLRNFGARNGDRLPKRMNGPSQSSGLSFPELNFFMKLDEYEKKSPRIETNFPDGITQFTKIEARSTSTSMTFSDDDEKEVPPPKRIRIKKEINDFALNKPSSLSMEYELISRGTQKGVYLSKFVDFDLSLLGLIPLIIADKIDRKLGKLALGKKCCYLLLGTSLIVTGIVVDVNIKEVKMQVSPDHGIDKEVDWIDVYRLYEIPDNLESVQRSVTSHIKNIMDMAITKSMKQDYWDPS
ncbi:unnamed protein product [Phytomonas sp. Hart1]|nr:unnamed protein product [Phytomonas sp. Hart1]|eukprot:CCW69778.1 unnamed protein product [Phytomonas sp. isolate Hart1]